MTSSSVLAHPYNRLTSLYRWVGRIILLVPTALAFASVCAGRSMPVDSTALPFAIGERITYQVTLASGSKVGTATMWIEGPVDVRGASTLLLRFDSQLRFLLLPAVSRSSSWFDPIRRASVRFSKRERNPLSHLDELVELYPDEKRWKSVDGETGTSPTSSPLDELSFIYFIRTLTMTPGARYSFDRHFDLRRNPVTVTVIRREVIPTPMGEMHVFRLEMRVRDPHHYEGEGVIRIHLSDDECRLPVRIESTMPVVGTAILTMTSEQSRCQPR